MEKNQNGRRYLQAGTMLTQKTNEDFNKKKPDPSDPNEQQSDPETTVPDIGDDEIDPVKGGTPDIGDDEIDPIKGETTNFKEGSYKSEGSE